MNDKIWIEKPNILFTEDKIGEFYPARDMNDNEKVNAITRFSIYFGIILYLIQDNTNYLYIPLMVSSCVYFLYYMNTKDKDFKVIDDTHVNIKKNFANYTLPTKKNPFMNLNVLDYGTNKVVKPALRGIKVQNN